MLITAKEAGERLGVTASAVKKWTKKENGPTATKDPWSTALLFNWSELKQFAVDTGRYDDIADVPMRATTRRRKPRVRGPLKHGTFYGSTRCKPMCDVCKSYRNAYRRELRARKRAA